MLVLSLGHRAPYLLPDWSGLLGSSLTGGPHPVLWAHRSFCSVGPLTPASPQWGLCSAAAPYFGLASHLLQRLLPAVLQMFPVAIIGQCTGLDSISGMRLEGNVGSKLCVVRRPKANSCVPLLEGRTRKGKENLGLTVCQDRGLCVSNLTSSRQVLFQSSFGHRHGTESAGCMGPERGRWIHKWSCSCPIRDVTPASVFIMNRNELQSGQSQSHSATAAPGSGPCPSRPSASQTGVREIQESEWKQRSPIWLPCDCWDHCDPERGR